MKWLVVGLWVALGYQLTIQYELSKKTRLPWWMKLVCITCGPVIWLGSVLTALVVVVRLRRRPERKETLH